MASRSLKVTRSHACMHESAQYSVSAFLINRGHAYPGGWVLVECLQARRQIQHVSPFLASIERGASMAQLFEVCRRLWLDMSLKLANVTPRYTTHQLGAHADMQGSWDTSSRNLQPGDPRQHQRSLAKARQAQHLNSAVAFEKSGEVSRGRGFLTWLCGSPCMFVSLSASILTSIASARPTPAWP